MIWIYWFNLTRSIRRKKYIKNALKKAENKIWENEFLKHQLWEVRGGMREQYDWLRERVDGAIRKLADTKYTYYYSEDKVKAPLKVMDIPLPPRELDNLPDKPTPPHRYHKVEKKHDPKVAEELERMIKLREPDLEQQKKQLEGVDAKVAEIDGAIGGLHELKASLISMLKKL